MSIHMCWAQHSMYIAHNKVNIYQKGILSRKAERVMFVFYSLEMSLQILEAFPPKRKRAQSRALIYCLLIRTFPQKMEY